MQNCLVLMSNAELALGGHSYERFARLSFYREVDRALVHKAPVVQRVVDFATGTGAIIKDLLDLGKLRHPFQVIGVDIDRAALQKAAQQFLNLGNSVRFIASPVESISQIPTASCELVTFGNSIHLTNPRLALREGSRVLIDGGVLLASTAYERLNAIPPETARMWGMLVALARRKLAPRYPNIPNPVNLFKYTRDDFCEMARDAGFNEISTETYTAQMDVDAVKAISDYGAFAEGALPGVNVEEATQALVGSVDEVFSRFKINSIPRNWMFLVAKKPLHPAAA